MNVARQPESVILGCTPEEAQTLRRIRLANDTDYSSYDIARLTDDTNKVYELLRSAELNMIGQDYDIGKAAVENNIVVIYGDSGVLLTAEHAASQQRQIDEAGNRGRKAPDVGTAALAYLTAKETDSNALIANGRQTSDPNNDDVSPFKTVAGSIVSTRGLRAALNLHGMMRGHTAAASDTKGFAVMLGIGDKASPATKALVDFMQEDAKDLGLRLGVNQEFLDFSSKNGMPEMEDAIHVKRKVFEAPPYTVRGYVQTKAEELGIDDSFASIQIEFSAALRVLLPESMQKIFPTESDREIGAYLGYHFLKKTVGNVALL